MKKLLFFLACLPWMGNMVYGQQTFLTKTHSNPKLSTAPMPYRLCMPLGYDQNKSYPIVLFLHGAGERGTNNTSQLTANKGATVWASTVNQEKNPCFVLAPQCGNDKQWVNTNWSNGSYKQNNIAISEQLSMAMDLLDSLCTVYPIDKTKLLITGISMGGYGTWDAITRFPTKFATAIPICGAGDPTKANLLSRLPIKCYHSSDDPIVPVRGTREMVKAINALGPNNRENFYTEFTDKGHGCWVAAYDDQKLIDWMFAEKNVLVDPKAACNITTLGGTATSQYTDSPANEGKDMIFDNLNNTKFLTFHNSSWIQFATNNQAAFHLTNYALTSGGDAPERDPKQVVLRGSNDGVNWTKLDSLNNISFAARLQTLDFNIQTTEAYSIYRIEMIATSGTMLQLSEIRLYGANENATGIKLTSKDECLIFPNPADKVINLNLKSNQNCPCSIVDQNGRIVKSLMVCSNSQQIDVASLEKGLYFVTVKGEKDSFTAKFIKK